MGHFGIKAMLAQLRQQGHKWPKMHKHVQEVCSSCKTCQRWNQAKKVFTQLNFIKAFRPWDHIQMDLITSFTEAQGYKYILTIVDIFTSFVVNIPLRTKEASEIISALWQLFTIMGLPKIIQTDNGGEFKNDLVTLLLKKLNVLHTTNVPYHHQAMGKVENQIKTVSAVLHKLLAEHGGEWITLLPAATLFINAKIREKTGVSPFALMFNRPTRLFDDQFGFKPEQEVDFPIEDDIAAWKLYQQQILDLFFPAISEMLTVKQQLEAEKFNHAKHVNIKQQPIPVGTVVYLYDTIRK
jgi:hypothetical protein